VLYKRTEKEFCYTTILRKESRCTEDTKERLQAQIIKKDIGGIRFRDKNKVWHSSTVHVS